MLHPWKKTGAGGPRASKWAPGPMVLAPALPMRPMPRAYVGQTYAPPAAFTPPYRPPGSSGPTVSPATPSGDWSWLGWGLAGFAVVALLVLGGKS